MWYVYLYTYICIKVTLVTLIYIIIVYTHVHVTYFHLNTLWFWCALCLIVWCNAWRPRYTAAVMLVNYVATLFSGKRPGSNTSGRGKPFSTKECAVHDGWHSGPFSYESDTLHPACTSCIIRKTSPCNEHPTTPHHYIGNWGLPGYTFFAYFCSKT